MLPTSAQPYRKRVKGSKPSFSLLGRGQREYETLGVGVIANRLAMGRVTVDRPVGKMAA
jgi:hypothetical protein